MKKTLTVILSSSLSRCSPVTSYEALLVAPTEQTMGDVQRIFYYHVPSAGWRVCAS